MVNWKDPFELAADGVAFSRFMHTLFGIYLWEVVTTLDFDWQVLSGRKRFRWPLIFYFAGRYCLLFALIGILVALDVTQPVDCQALYTFNQVFGNAAIGLASVNLCLRTIAVWSNNRIIVCLLVSIMFGQWSFLLHGLLLKAAWMDGTCVITYTDNKILAVSFIYTMAFDFLVLCLTAWKLAYPAGGRSKLIKLIFGDGLIYFVIAFLSNLLATIFMLLNLNAIMSVIANVPAAIACTTVACRLVRRLINFTSHSPEMFVTGGSSTLAFRTVTAQTHGKFKTGEGLHVQMDVITAGALKEGDGSFGVVSRAKDSESDPEAQAIRDEFKMPPY